MARGAGALWLPPALLLLCVPGAHSSAVTGPGAVSGSKWASLTVRCHYGPGWEPYRKYWCRGFRRSSCRILVQTSGSEQEVKKGRVSIRDHQKSRTFSVTMESLRLDDTDTYWCGIEEAGADPMTQVQVIVHPVFTTTTSTTSTTTTAITTASTIHTAPVTPGESKVPPPPGNTSTPTQKILPPLIAAGLLLVLVATSLLAWGLVRRRRTAPGIAPEQAPESELCYTDLVLRPPRPSRKEAPARSPSVARMEVEHHRRKEDVTYVALSFGTAGQEPTYSNTEQLSSRTPSRAQEEASEYSTVRKP